MGDATIFLAEALVFLLGFKFIFSRDRFFGIFYLFLVVYALPAQVGYHYLGELSALTVGYFGPEVWYRASVFIILSLCMFWASFGLLRRRISAVIPLQTIARRSRAVKKGALLATIATAAVLTYEASYFVLNFADINWYTAQDEDFVAAKSGYYLFLFLIKLLVAVAITCYVLVRQRGGVLPRRLQLIVLALALAVFFAVALRLGNRTDLVAFSLGVAVFESSRVAFTATRVLKAAVLCLIAFLLLSSVESLRYTGGQEELGLAASLLLKDYYAPAHMLFAAMANGFIEPAQVIVSNFSNSLVMLHQPYLQEPITNLFRPGVATRSTGYAFYVLTEGYVFMGGAGFIYNGLVLLVGLSVWRKLARSNSKRLNEFLLAIMGCMLVNLVRGQSSYLVKYLYTFVMPGMILYCLLAGLAVKIRVGFPVRNQEPQRVPDGAVSS